MSQQELRFPDGFLWGAATAAHQVEGNNTNNDWWAWEQSPGRIRNGDRAALACDWWHRAEEDLDRARDMGQNTHRFSVEWSRLEPRPGVWDAAAFRRYREMLLAMRQRGLEPMLTLFHFTAPLWLADLGGWENPRTVDYFAQFTERVVNELGDLVRYWCPINELAVYAFLGFMHGIFPPGKRAISSSLAAMRHQLLGHGEAYRVIHALQAGAQVGAVSNIFVAEALDPDRIGDRLLARAVDYIHNVLPLEAISTGWIKPPAGAMYVPKLADSADFIGLNYYTRFRTRADWRRPANSFQFHLTPGSEISDLDYGEVYPRGMYQTIQTVSKYNKPIYITENGLPDADDDQRPRFILTHLAQIWRAIRAGLPVRGYYHWSLVDNFEWAQGYAMRFGLIEVDFATQERRTRASGRLYAEICRANAITEDMVRRYAPEALEAVFGS
jgi:beta-glucosidase